jgi:hypothetical protein
MHRVRKPGKFSAHFLGDLKILPSLSDIKPSLPQVNTEKNLVCTLNPNFSEVENSFFFKSIDAYYDRKCDVNYVTASK